MTRASNRTLASHVQASISAAGTASQSTAGQAKKLESAGRAQASHVERMVAAVVQAKGSSGAPSHKQNAAHVQRALAAHLAVRPRAHDPVQGSLETASHGYVESVAGLPQLPIQRMESKEEEKKSVDEKAQKMVNRLLKFLKKAPSVKAKLQFISSLLEEGECPLVALEALLVAMAADIMSRIFPNKTLNNEDVKAIKSFHIQNGGKLSGCSKVSLAQFFTESIRGCHMVQHKWEDVEWFLAAFKKLGGKVGGELDECRKLSTMPGLEAIDGTIMFFTS